MEHHARWRNLRPSNSAANRTAESGTRRVGGVVGITGGTLGLKRNIVVATAVNAQAAFNVADTRVPARRQASPAVTG